MCNLLYNNICNKFVDSINLYLPNDIRKQEEDAIV